MLAVAIACALRVKTRLDAKQSDHLTGEFPFRFLSAIGLEGKLYEPEIYNHAN